MLVKIQILLALFSHFVFCQVIQSISPYSMYASEVINKRILQVNSSNCEKMYKTYCQKCKDKFLQPYCSKCPIGYKLVNNKCIKCGDYQLFCGSPDPDDYCYKGFVKIGDQCVCQGKSIVSNYCLSNNEIAYTEKFIDNKILIQFSSEIQLTTSEPDKYLICVAVLNNFNQYNNKIQCYLNSDNPSQFYIELDKSALQDNKYAIIPKIKNDYITFKSNNQQPNIIYQPSYLKSENLPQTYFENNDYTSLLSHFKKSVYYIDINTMTFMQIEEFVDLFSTSDPTFTDSTDFNLLTAFGQYPKNQVQIPFQGSSKNNLIVPLTFENIYPYNVLLSNTVTFKTADFQTSFSEFTLKNPAPYFSDEATPIIIKSGIPGVNFSEDDEFQLVISIYKGDERTNEFPAKVKFKNFPYTFNIPPYAMNFDPQAQPNTFRISVQPFLYTAELISSQQEINISGKPLQVQIVGGDRENVDPREIIQLNGQARNPIIKDSNPEDFTYIWNCYDEVLKTNCKNEFLKDLTLQQLSKISLNANTFDFQGTYTLTVEATEINNNKNIIQSKITIKTIAGNLQIDYDKLYDTSTLLPDELLKFKLEYTGDDKLKNSYLDHSFEIGFEYQQVLILTSQSTPQKENFIFTRLIDSVSEEYLKGSLNFFMRFFVLDQNQKIVDATRRINFQTNPPPYDCKLVFENGITGKEVSFVDKIKLKASNCKSSINDGKLKYQFLYYNEDKFQNNEKQFPDILHRKYLTKFQEEDSIETYLPPGQIVFVVVVKDSKETKIKFSSSITIKQNTFDQTQYEDFLKNQNSEATAFYQSTQYEKQVCVYGMMIECIENFENQNQNLDLTQKVSDLKDFLKKQFLYLPSLIPNDLMSQSLQEFTVRCLKRLYNTVYGPDKQNQINRLNDVSDFVKQRIDLMKTLKPFVPEVRDTYRKKMLITLDITAQTIEQLSSSTMSTPSASWSNLQIKDVSQNLESLALTLYVNQQSIVWNTQVVNVQVQKVDQFNLFKNYLDYDMAKFGDSDLESNQIYNVEIQQWKDNIYSFEQSYKDMVEPSISKTNDPQIISYLKQTYPAIYPRVTKSYEVNRRLRQLEEEEFLTLPANINSEFKDIKGNKKVKCAQRVKDVWTKSSCKTSVIQTGDTFTVSCSCSTPSFTSIVADVEALFQNSNINKIFSEAGINTLLSLDNWYQYSAVYVLIVINIAVIVSFVIGVKLDKADAGISGQQSQTTAVNTLMIDRQQNEIKNQKNNSEQSNQNKVELKNKQSTKKSSSQEGSPDIDFKNNSLIDIKDIEYQITRSPTKATTIEIKKDQIQNESKVIIEKKFNYEVPQKWEQNEQPIQKLNCETNQENPSQTEESQKYVDNICTMYRINYVECKDREQHQFPMNEDLRKFSAFDMDADIALQTQEKKTELSKKDIKKLKQQQKESQKKEQDAKIQKQSLEYLLGLSVFKGTCVFHDLLQIFIVYDRKKTRLFRFSIFYNQLIWLLTLSATFGESLTIVQVIALSVVSSIIFGLLKVILKFILNKKSIIVIGYILIFCFLLFCYYAIAVVMGSQQPSQVNGWIINYILAQCIDIFISGVISSAVKYYSTLKCLPKYQISHLVYKFTSADTLFEVFK